MSTHCDSIIVLQARLNSSRLPGKALLPVCGIPLVVLAALRAGNRGRPVLVVTSEETSDDPLVSTLEKWDIPFKRGSLDNVLLRFTQALEDLDDTVAVIRLTGDNVFPDGELIDDVYQSFSENKHDYLCCNGAESNQPYGVSVEITYLKHLREACDNSTDIFEQEHVTPYVRDKYGSPYYVADKQANTGMLRCTVDCLDDYQTVFKVFEDVSDPVHEPLISLVNKQLSLRPPIVQVPADKLVIGTAQLGMDYGITNRDGAPSQRVAVEMLKLGIENGVQFIDTAQAYGHSESIIGNLHEKGWRGRATVITKIPPLPAFEKEPCRSEINPLIDSYIYKSCASLKLQTLDYVLLHRASLLTEWDGIVWDRLKEHKRQGLIKRLGASVQSPEELALSLADDDVELIQFPYNILDWRWDDLIDQIHAVKHKRHLILHARSAYLQGLLLSDDKKLWAMANVDDNAFLDVHDFIMKALAIRPGADFAEICIAYLRSLDWIDGITLGAVNIEQLTDNIALFDKPCLAEQEMEFLKDNRPILGEATLNPAKWNR